MYADGFHKSLSVHPSYSHVTMVIVNKEEQLITCLSVTATKLMRPRMKAGGKVNTRWVFAVFSIDCCRV